MLSSIDEVEREVDLHTIQSNLQFLLQFLRA